MPALDPRRIAMIGFGEVGGIFARDLTASGRHDVAAEMRESAVTVDEAGLIPLMAEAIAGRQDWVADRAAAQPALRLAKDADWRATLDAMAGR